MLMSEMPREIIDLIVAELVACGTNLPPLLFLSRVFHTAVRNIIFKDVVIVVGTISRSGEEMYTNTSLLLDAIQADLDNLQSIRNLSLRFVSHAPEELDARLERGWSRDWMSILPTTLSLLLTSPIATLTIQSSGWISHLPFSRLDRSSLGGLIALRSLPSMRKLIFRHLAALPLELLIGSEYARSARFDQVSSVVMYNVGIDAVTLGSLGSNPANSGASTVGFVLPPHLAELEIDSACKFLQVSASQNESREGGVVDKKFVQLNRLTTLIVTEVRDEVLDMTAMAGLITSASSLEKLSLGIFFAAYGRNNGSQLDSLYKPLQQANSLRSLDLTSTKSTMKIPHAIQNMVRFLLRISATPNFNIQHIRLTFKWSNTGGSGISQLEEEERNGPLTRLVDGILNKQRSLKSFALVVLYSPHGFYDSDSQKENLVRAKRFIERHRARARSNISFTYDFIETEFW